MKQAGHLEPAIAPPVVRQAQLVEFVEGVTTVTDRLDLAVYDRKDQLVLVAEVKKKLDVPSEWAARLRRNILAHGTYPNAPYFLMAFPDRFYLWVNSTASVEARQPDYVIDAQPILKPYLEQARITAEQISEQSLEMIVASWLNGIIYSEENNKVSSQTEQWVVESGLLDAIVGGRFEYEVVV